jgi:hypothetical protein
VKTVKIAVQKNADLKSKWHFAVLKAITDDVNQTLVL